MDLDQRKLNKSEWETIEVPVSQEERDVLNLIIRGYHDVQIKIMFNKWRLQTILKLNKN